MVLVPSYLTTSTIKMDLGMAIKLHGEREIEREKEDEERKREKRDHNF